MAPKLLSAGVRVIDVSGAFRLRAPSLYPAWYGFAHPAPELLGEAVYGLTEWCGQELAGARLVANPGCYPTSILLPLLPLALSELLPDPLVPHAASTATPTIHRAIILRIYAHKRRSGGRSIRLVCAATGRRAKSRVEAQR